MTKSLIPLFVFTLLYVNCLAQTSVNKIVSISLRDATISQLVTELENKTSYHFYYDAIQLDSVRITVDVREKPVDAILDIAFKNSELHYAFGFNNEVFITKGHEIKTELASGYYNNNTTSSEVKTNNIPADIFDDNIKQVPKATMENKLYEIGVNSNQFKVGNATLAGYVRNIKTGEPLVGISIYVEEVHTGVATDRYGYYSISLPKGRQVLIIRGIGVRNTRRQILLTGNGELNIELQEQMVALREVNISSKIRSNVKSVQMGVNRLDIKSIKQVPAVFGETDILRVVLTLPGVQSVGEASTGFNVRGGSADQNLILLNGLTVYNPSHFFGFFSAFNPDIVKDLELYKSTIPEKYGGRLSSVLDITNRDGSLKKFTGTAGIGLLTGRFNIEGPIVKDKTSFIFGSRTSYSNWLLKLLPNEYKNSKANFYDFNLGITHHVDEKNSIYLTTYLSNDNFKLNSDTTYGYSNKNASLKWKHVFNNKLNGAFNGGFDRYQYSVSSNHEPVNAYKLNFDINQFNLKTDFNYYLSAKHTLDFGLSIIYYKLNPGSFQANSTKSLIVSDVVPSEKALESALYIGDHFDINPKLSINYGLRYSLYNYLGAQTIHIYAPGLPKEQVNLIDSAVYGDNNIIKTYHAPEIRVSARYSMTDDFSIKAAYNTLQQYIHLLSNTAAIAPTDIYKLSDPNIKPQNGHQISLGLYKNFKANTIETSLEVYYKRLNDYLDYKSGATLVLNHHIETDVINTRGKAYGIEFLIRKETGKLNGWVSYTYSRVLLKQDDPNAGQLINGGSFYPADYDKPHSFNFIGNYRISHRFNFSLNVTYSSGRPITLPIAKYFYAGSERVLYSDRNAYRIPDYFRSDISMNIDGNHKVHQLTHNSWTLGVYNLTGRQNAFSTYFTSQNGGIGGFKLSIFATAIPFVNYNIRF